MHFDMQGTSECHTAATADSSPALGIPCERRVPELTDRGDGLQVIQAVHPVGRCRFSGRTAGVAFAFFQRVGLTVDSDFSFGGRHVSLSGTS